MLNVTSTAPPSSPAPTADTARPLQPDGQLPAPLPVSDTALLLLLVPVVLLYLRIGAKLVRDWYNIADDSHGFLIPLFVGFLVWTSRDRYRAIPRRTDWTGVPLVLVALLVLLTGVFGADIFLQRLSFVLLASGLIWSLLGRAMLKQLSFPIGILLLAIPLPMLVLNHITFPLQLLASRLAGDLLPLAGVPVLREGNVINLAAMQLEVAEACSGIRSLMSLLTVAIIFGYFMEGTNLRRILLALSSVPIAVAANALRIFGTGLCVQYWDPEKAMGFFHEFSGWLIFLVSLTLLYSVHLLMGKFWPQKEIAS